MVQPSGTPHSTAAVIGAGIAGTAAAFRLRAAGFAVTLFEASDRVGGRIQTVRKGDFLMDTGPAGLLSTFRDTLYLITEAGLDDDLVKRPLTVGIRRGDKSHHFDYADAVRTVATTKLVGAGSKVKALKLVRDVYKNADSLGYNTYDDLAALDSETVREYAARRLNDELLKYAVQPLMAGTWDADDEHTSAALLQWTVRNMLRPRVYNLTSGMAALPTTLAGTVDTRLGHAVRNVTDNGGAVEVSYAAPGEGERTETFDACVIATTARPAMDLFPQMDELTTALYSTAAYRSMGTVSLGLSKRPGDPATYFLVPPAEDPDTVAVIADHNKAPGRAPVGKGLITVQLSHDFIQRGADLTDDQLLAHALDRASRYYGDLSGTLEEYTVARWPEAIPALVKGRVRQIAEYRSKINRAARVQFASDLERIPGFNGSVSSANKAAARVVALFDERTQEAIA
jgi:protoporphyrinogen oxidase